MISSQVLYCNGVAKISVRENIQQNALIKDFWKFLKFIKNLHKNFKNSPNLIKNKNLIEFKKILKQFNKILKNFKKLLRKF